jgi:hypothetical protein
LPGYLETHEKLSTSLVVPWIESLYELNQEREGNREQKESLNARFKMPRRLITR